MLRLVAILAIFSFCGIASASPFLQGPQTEQGEQLALLRERMEKESNPVRRAKAFPRYGDALIEQIRRESSSGNYDQALKLLEDYRDAVKSSYQGLKESGLDADKKPAGFKSLQIHLRHSLSQLKLFVLTVPLESRQNFQEIENELEKIDSNLVDALFPRQPGKKHESQRKP